MAADTTGAAPSRVLHLAGLWSIGVVQPIFDILGNNPEFFVAHGTRGRDLICLVLGLCLVGPMCVIVPTLCAARVGRRSYQVVTWAAVAVLVTAIALPIVKRSWDLDTAETFATAGAMGMVLASGYIAFSALRLFATFMSLATVVVPVVFLLQPAMTGLLWAEDDRPLPRAEFAATPPVVMLVFDQLPLPSLLDRESEIDETFYPHFSSLSQDASWFRNASTVGALNDVALPAILTGNRPTRGLLPTATDHPDNLFALLGSAYRVEAFEPLTRLCPEPVCPPQRPPPVVWYASVLLDLSVVYQHFILPDELTARLPPITQNWKEFVANDSWSARWLERRRTDRRQPVHEFIESIGTPSPDDRPPFYFAHVLLPHEPWVYLPSGQRFTSVGNTVGLARSGH